MNLGPLGVWYFLESLSAKDAAAAAQRIEALGYAALWIPEAVGRHAFAQSSWLLANTQRLIIATGIANIYARDPAATAAAQKTLAEQSGGRFLLGLGVSHRPMVENVRGHVYASPVKTMRSYLERMAKAPYMSVQPPEPPPTVLAALGPQMLRLSAKMTRGAHPYFTTPEHTAFARKELGQDAWLCVEQKVLLETDPAKARALGRAAAQIYLGLENYRNNWKAAATVSSTPPSPGATWRRSGSACTRTRTRVRRTSASSRSTPRACRCRTGRCSRRSLQGARASRLGTRDRPRVALRRRAAADTESPGAEERLQQRAVA